MTTIQRDNPAELAIGLFDMASKLLDTARKVSQAGVGPILGGIAVYLHGYRRTTQDINIYMVDPKTTRSKLEELGAVWDDDNREFVLDGVVIHVIDDRVTGSVFEHTSEIDGVRVVGLVDLIRFKLHSGLQEFGRGKDLADVEELIRIIPLDKAFVGKLPKDQRAAFKQLVDRVKAQREIRLSPDPDTEDKSP